MALRPTTPMIYGLLCGWSALCWVVVYELYVVLSGSGSISTFCWWLAAALLVSLLAWDSLAAYGSDVVQEDQSQSHTD